MKTRTEDSGFSSYRGDEELDEIANEFIDQHLGVVEETLQPPVDI
jgi:hypothetical protein